jgi:carbon storage regulator
VRLGVSAPPSVPVHRREIYDQIREENRRAVPSADAAAQLAERLRRAPVAVKVQE